MPYVFVPVSMMASAQAPLDAIAGATAGYSTRKLRAAYAGACLRIRRSSDNTEQDIGFVGTLLDTAALLTFCGAGNGFVRTWYDQSGNVRHLGNTTQSAQPQLVASGAVITSLAGQPSLDFDGVNDVFVPDAGETLAQFLTASAGTLATIFQIDTLTSDDADPVEDQALWSGQNKDCLTTFHQTGSLIRSVNDDGAVDHTPQTVATVTPSLHVWRHGSGTLDCYLNSSTPSSVASGDSVSVSTSFLVGAKFTANVYFDGQMAEMITYNTALSSGDLDALAAAMVAPYGVSWS